MHTHLLYCCLLHVLLFSYCPLSIHPPGDLLAKDYNTEKIINGDAVYSLSVYSVCVCGSVICMYVCIHL